MSHSLDRREFVATGAAVTAGLIMSETVSAEPAATGTGSAPLETPVVLRRTAARPVVVASGNGHGPRGPDGRSCVETAFARMTEGGDVLDALIAGVTIVELDPEDTSVGYGGLPNGDGVVQLDASVMHGPKRQAGAVAALEGVRTPAAVARAVMQNTDHHLLVAEGAQRFARQMGFAIEDDLNTERSRRQWLEFRRRVDPSRWLNPEQRGEESLRVGLEMVQEGLIDAEHFWGTINCNGVSANGDVCGVTTTSGLAWKIPGRVGDSPILGAGLYVDNDVGAAGSTGRGEANLYGLCSFLIVENMRRGMTPVDAGVDACRRIATNTVEPRLLNERGLPRFGINFYIVNAAGDYAGVSMYAGSRFAVCDERGARLEDCAAAFDGRATGG
ncbi:MAG TPA: N(4)-(beta-N-acetylglucosaminyl)-L-asparaginase [Longimicrobiales bacterium]|nr:N(4)-(beta-N-acetylglucosaminyl)-L-asparaginase [Longimicrobiales bacterium]